jgi:hypothetical protein
MGIFLSFVLSPLILLCYISNIITAYDFTIIFSNVNTRTFLVSSATKVIGALARKMWGETK